MTECPNCGNIAKFTVAVTTHRVYIKTFDEEGELTSSELDKSSEAKLETWICGECGNLITQNEGRGEEPPKDKTVYNKQKKHKKSNNNKQKKPATDEKPTEKQLKYLNDLADLLEIPEEDRQGFEDMTKKQVSDKLTEYYKQCKRKGIEI
jgi:hypothetical protein